MAIYVYTSRPNALLREMREAARSHKIDTWICDSDGDFTHAPEQWVRKAWLRPKVEEGSRLIFNIVALQHRNLSRVVYGVYHGRFAEMVLVHFDDKCERVTVTALPSAGDSI